MAYPTVRRVRDSTDGKREFPRRDCASGVLPRFDFVLYPMEEEERLSNFQWEGAAMKFLNCLIVLAVLQVGAGCRSSRNSVASDSRSSQEMNRNAGSQETTAAPVPEEIPGARTVQQGSIGNSDYTIQMIPNTRLSATSREGDKPTEVYSSNIIAVYVQPHKGVTVSSTNLPTAPKQGDNLKSVGK
jgi:hypothetical protein